ncbi:hypothetical protein M4578_03735 [Salipiger sp. P9]|uniref:hypothetical protein n=1 Tax=Salipiger pentaromativorans TaxID=2943193 RepID=UPI00215830F5|nr:hypothetical protein [Salipiger pentaromativorans]MCR8546927.1 hypothetical protein [Salipiger pentaromativorans]
MNILIGTILIWGAALWALAHLNRTAPEARPELYRRATETFLFMLPRLVVGLVGAGFLAALLPEAFVQRWLSAQSGLQGILIASGFGLLTPGGPFVAFAIGASALKAGAGAGALVAYITAWSLVSMVRTLSYEVPLMGRQFTLARVLISLPAPILLGLCASLLF